MDKLRDDGVQMSSLMACGCVFILLGATISASDFVRYKLANLRHALVESKNSNLPNTTIAMYYEGGLFDQIKVHLGVGWKFEKVISVGIDPMIASVNGFQHLDGYFQSYPLSYNKKFRRIIAPEFEKDTTKKTYFDDWGNRVYIFAERRSGNNLTLNIDGCVAARLGASLVISRYRIVNAADSLLLPAGEITGSTQGVPSSARLYRISTDRCPGI